MGCMKSVHQMQLGDVYKCVCRELMRIASGETSLAGEYLNMQDSQAMESGSEAGW